MVKKRVIRKNHNCVIRPKKKKMAAIEIVYKGNNKTECVDPSARVIASQTNLPAGEAPEAYNPMQLLCIAGAACTLSTLGAVAQVHNFSVEGMKATVDYTVTDKPKQLKRIHMVIDLRGHDYSPKEKKILQLATEQCLVIRSLSADVEKVVEFLFS